MAGKQDDRIHVVPDHEFAEVLQLTVARAELGDLRSLCGSGVFRLVCQFRHVVDRQTDFALLDYRHFCSNFLFRHATLLVRYGMSSSATLLKNMVPSPILVKKNILSSSGTRFGPVAR